VRQFQTTRLEALPFEELQNRYKSDDHEIYKEFTRRLHRLVFYASEDFLKRQGVFVGQEEIEELVMRVFEDFGPEFGSGEPIMLLVRFANAIRRVLDPTAFDRISTFYYPLLPAYHISDDLERRYLVGAYQEALGNKQGKMIDEVLAERFETTASEASSILKRARQELDEIIQSEFEVSELQQATEGCLP
jgi:hypothetical protein